MKQAKQAKPSGINWLANSAGQFDKVDCFAGSMQSNHGHELTYDLRVIAHSMVGELGINQLAQMSDAQLYTCYRFFFQDLDRRMDHKLATRGARFAIVHNATTNSNERLYRNGQIALPYVKRNANNCVVIVFGKRTIAFHVSGEYMVK